MHRLWIVLVIALTLPTSPTLRASDFRHIAIDGDFGDWAGILPAYEDESETTDGTDFKSVYLAHDDQYLYVRFALYAAGEPFTARNNIFLDADNDSSTGFPPAGRVFGSEMLIQSGTGYQEKGGGFNEGAINGLDWSAAPAGPSTDFEFRISRSATFASDGSPVFAADTVALLLEAENAQFATVDTAPDLEGLIYTFTPPPPPASSNSVIVSLTDTSWQVNDAGTDLQTQWRESGFDDTATDWSTGSGLFGLGVATAYPAPISKTLAPAATYYLRTRFEWTNDPNSVILVASNYLSDGAVFYLNGAEVRRVRMPEGVISFNTPATGPAPQEGAVELFTLPSNPLNIGENVLAVELHQTAGDQANLVFGLSLFAATQFPVIITDPNAPADRTVVAGQSTTFETSFAATEPVTFQWLKNGEPVLNATNRTLTLDPVLAADAGTYSVRITNPLTNTTSRGAVLTVSGVPVKVVTEPADQTVAEGEPFVFTVVAEGSAPLSYQWYHAGVAIPGATNASYTNVNASLADAGLYNVTVTNPVPSSVTSARAQLTVNRDTTAPLVETVSGTPNLVMITFSEPLSPASATNAANYALGNGLTINAIDWLPETPNAVTLRTSAQALGTNYTLTLNNLADRFGNAIAPNTTLTFTSTIVIDGTFDDWTGVDPVLSDPEDSTESTDYKDIYLASDENYLYLRVTLHTPSDLGIFYNNIFFDTDNDASTGYPFRLGSEMLVQGGGGYQQKNRGFNEGGIDGLDWAQAPEGVGTDFELRISRKARYTSDQLPVFTGNTIALVLESENTSFQTRDTAPDEGILTYDFSGNASIELGPLSIQPAGADVTISWPGTGRLQTRDSLTTGEWQDVPDAVSGLTIQTSAREAYYRLIE